MKISTLALIGLLFAEFVLITVMEDLGFNTLYLLGGQIVFLTVHKENTSS